MKTTTKRFLSFALAFLMLVGCLPAGVWTTHVHAAQANTLTGLSVSGLTVTYSNVSNENGSSSWSGGGTTINGEVDGYKSSFMSWASVSSSISFKNDSGSEATLSFDYVLENGGSVTGISGGKCSNVLAAGAELTVKLTSKASIPSQHTGSTKLTITNIKLVPTSAADVTTTFPTVVGGSYTVNGTPITATTLMTNAAGTDYVLVATPDNQKQFLGWYDETAGAYVGYTSTFTFSPTKDASVHPVFVDATTALFGVGAARFDDLNKAAAAALSGGDKTVFLVNNGTLAAGDYTIPAGVTLLIPFDDANTVLVEGTSIDKASDVWGVGDPGVYQTPTAYRTLTMAPGAHVTVNGNLNVGGKHSHGNSSGQLTAGSPSGKVGMINMSAGSSIVLNNGANLHCWGFIYGGGSITAKSGATVHENFQFTDFRGGICTTTMAGDLYVFPLSQYYVQNVEVAVTYEYGAKEKVWTSIYVSKTVQSAGVDFIGEGAMFVPADGGSIVKKYDPATDRLIIDINGGGSINSMSLALGSTKINSQDFVLPINSNITVNINSGEVSVNQSIALLPGAKVTVAQNATLKISSSSESSSLYQGRENLFIYSAQSWKHGISLETGEDTAAYFVHSGKRLSPIAYTPTRTKTRTEADLVDAVLDVNGTLVTDGFVYTTDEMVNGGILSSEKTGKVVMNNGVGQDVATVQANQGGSEGKTPIYLGITIISAQLRNSNGSYVATAVLGADDDGNTTITSTSGSNAWTYCATCDKWVSLVTIKYSAGGGDGSMADQVVTNCGCNKLTTNGFTNGTKLFDGWKDGNGNTYQNQATIDSTFDGEITLTAQWKEAPKTVTITWSINGNTDNTSTANYGANPSYTGDDPTKGFDATNHYAFAGWSKTEGGAIVDFNDFELTEDVTFFAVFAPTAHTYGDWKSDGTYHWKECSCGWTAEKNQHNDANPVDHKCDTCGKTLTAHQLEHVDALAANCLETGNIEYWHCTLCGKNYSDAAGTTEVTNVTTEIDPSNHKETLGTAWESDGTGHWHKYTCCGVKGDTLLHNDPDNDHYCDECGYQMSDHDYSGEWSQGENTHWHECICGDKADEASHDDPDNDHYCDECGYKMSEHDYSGEWSQGENTHWHECICGDKADEASHDDSDNDHYCDECGYQMSDHDYSGEWSQGENTHWHECICGDKADEASHDDSDKNHECDECGYQMSNHTLEYVKGVQENCLETGIQEHWHCDYCGKDYSDADGEDEIIDVILPKDPNVHKSDEFTYTYVDVTQHEKVHACCHVSAGTEAHTTDANHDCICGAVTITYFVPTTGREYSYTVKRGDPMPTPPSTYVAPDADYHYDFLYWFTADDGQVEIPTTATVSVMYHAIHKLTEHSGGTATCQEQAKCEYCETPYGELGDHAYTKQDASEDAKLEVANCQSPAKYYYSCAYCDSIEGNAEHFFTSGEKNPDNHTSTEYTYTYVDAETHRKAHKCCDAFIENEDHTKDDDGNCICGAITVTYWVQGVFTSHTVNYGADMPTPPSTDMTPDSMHHFDFLYWYTFGSNSEIVPLDALPTKATVSEVYYAAINSVEHTGGTATCQEQAKCEYCEKPYGELGDHAYTRQDASEGAKLEVANCQSAAKYYYSCAYCDSIEGNAEHYFESGDKDSDNHTSTEYTYTYVDEETHSKAHKCCGAFIENEAHTTDVNSDCICGAVMIFYGISVDRGVIYGEYHRVERGASMPTPPSINLNPTETCHYIFEYWCDNFDNNAQYDELPSTADKSAWFIATIRSEEHSGGTATCKEKAVCTYCETPYGTLADHNYEGATVTYTWKYVGVITDIQEGKQESVKNAFMSILEASSEDAEMYVEAIQGNGVMDLDFGTLGWEDALTMIEALKQAGAIATIKATCQASRSCQTEGCSHTDTTEEKAATATVTTEGTCTTEEEITYTVTFDEDWAGTKTQDVTGVKDLANHTGTLGTAWEHDNDKHYHVWSCCNAHADEDEHTFDQETVAEGYLKDAKTCYSYAVYYKSCVCGVTSTEAFEDVDGGMADHNYEGATVTYTWKYYIFATGIQEGKRESVKNYFMETYGVSDETAEAMVQMIETSGDVRLYYFNTWEDALAAREALKQAGAIFQAPVTCQASRSCQTEGCSHTDTTEETGAGAALKTMGTCKTAEEITYTVTFNETWATTQTQDVTGVKDPDTHASTEYTYTYVDEETHSKAHACCGASAGMENHAYTEGKCVCGHDQTFTITVKYGKDGAQTNTMTVNYGEKPNLNAYRNDYYYAADEGVNYIFNQWDKTVTEATEDTTYTAVYVKTGWQITAEGRRFWSRGILMHNWLNLTSGESYYLSMDRDGYAYTGIAQVGDSLYAFDDVTGALIKKDGVYVHSEGTFYLESGKLVQNKGLVRWEHKDNDGNITDVCYYYFTDTYEGFENIKASVALKDGGSDLWVSDTNGTKLPVWGYFTDANGAFIHYDYTLNGIHTEGGVKYYLIDGIGAHVGMIRIDGYVYYAKSRGNLAVSETYYCTIVNDTGYAEGLYTFDADGHMTSDITLEWDEAHEHLYCYDVNHQLTYAGLINYPGDDAFTAGYYYVRTSGEAVVGRDYWITKTNGLMGERSYTFDENGRMVNPGEKHDTKNGIVAENDSLYYYENGVLTYAGLIQIDGSYYYVKTSGEVVHGRSYWITKTNGLMPEKSYTFDEDGKMVDPALKDTAKNGIVEENGSLYYYENGMQTYAGLIYYDGDDARGEGYYYVKTNCEVVHGRDYWITKTNGLMGERSYNFAEDGHMTNPIASIESDATGIVPGDDGGLRYYENGILTYAGLIQIGGNYYYVKTSGEVVCGQTYWITKTNGLKDEGSYTFAEDGKMVVAD